MADALLLDTHVLIWLQEGVLGEPGTRRVLEAATASVLLVSTVSAWEVGQIQRKTLRTGQGLSFAPDPVTWYRRAVTAPGVREIPISAEIAIRSALLPPPLHGDPGDRLLVATAREIGAVLMTRDQRILDYAALGHVRAVAC